MTCATSHCVTCSDEAVRMVVLVTETQALARCVGDDGTVADVMTELVGDVAPGDALLVHAGTALARAA